MSIPTLLPSATVDDVLPVVHEHARWMEENRNQHPDVLDALRGAGLFDLRRPAHLGGAVPSFREITGLVSTLARADGSTAWNVAVSTITSWMAAHLPDPAVDEIFAEPGVQICGTLSPGGALQPSADGSTYVLDGGWRFISGARTSRWQMVIAMTPAPGDAGMMPALAAVPLQDLRIVDDWHTAGLRGTGSVTTAATGVVVPAHRVLPLPVVLDGHGACEQLAGDARFGSPLVATASGLSAAVAPGLAAAALDLFRGRAADRGITYTAYARQSEAAVTHLQVGEADLLVDESTFQAYAIADALDAYDGTPGSWTTEQRAAARGRLGRSTELALRAARLVGDASGGTSIHLESPIQRVVRDLQAMSQHALISPATNRELHGRVLCGLEPTTLYV